MSRQREYQKRMRLEGRCITCGDPALDSRRKNNPFGKSAFCATHMAQVRERNRNNRVVKAKRRYWNAASYKEILDAHTNIDTNNGGGEPEST